MEINIHHVGGLGDCGPAERFKKLKANWIIYDASEGNLSVEKKENITYINRCLGDKDGEIDFYEFINSSANSIYPSNPDAYDYQWESSNIPVWGKWTQLKKKSKMKVNRFDTLKQELNLPDIDVLSMDCQGSEWNIMHSVSEEDWNNILFVILEVEFAEIYLGQKLYPEVKEFLESKGFELLEMGRIYYFHDEEKEFPCYAEPIFIKKRELVLKNQLEKYQVLLNEHEKYISPNSKQE